MILDLGLGQRGLLDHRPHHRLLAAIERAVDQELRHLAIDVGLGLEAHGGIRVLPVADHAQPLELLPLDVDPLLCELAAFAAEIDDRDVVLALALLAIALLDLPLDRQAVAVPARHVDGVPAQHLLVPVDHVLENLVQGRAHVQVAVGVGRAVMQDEGLAAGCHLAQPRKEVELIPALEPLRLALGQVGLHAEIRPGQGDGVAVVLRHRAVIR